MSKRFDVDVTVPFSLVLDDYSSKATLQVAMRYGSADPYAVQVVFSDDEMEVEWVFARSLLRTGTTEPCGEGDVHIWPGQVERNAVVQIVLRSPDGQALLEASVTDVTDFLDRCSDVVPEGEEPRFIDWDAIITKLLG